jgi:heptaprenyl diphosphate synthase
LLNKNTSLSEMKDLITTNAFHPFLLDSLETPKIDEDKLLLLMSLFNQLEITEEEQKSYISSTMLVQMALDTHENVNEVANDADREDCLRGLQLTVLAGDYYSGLYYQLLAKAGSVSLIRVLASAIKEINEHKILLYQKSMEELSTVLDSIRTIEAALIRNIADCFNVIGWKELSSEMLLLNRLHIEKKQYLEGGHSIIFEILKKMSFPRKDKSSPLSKEQTAFLINKMDQCIIYAQNSLKNVMGKLSIQNGMLQARIASVLEYTAVPANSFVEEG